MELIVVDGIDGSGKSTVAEWIADHYRQRGETVLVRTHPSDSFFGRSTRRALASEGRTMRALASALFIADVLHSLRRLRSWKGYDKVIFVRYIMATAYLPGPLYKQGYELFRKVLPVPPRLLLVDVPPECALRRIEGREHAREMFENLEALHKVRGKVLALSSQGWKVLDNRGPIDEARSQLERVLAEWEGLS
ncbi:MAG TPA: thymidylate kinase [Methanomassiliicoccales archaeon]|nr:thymidylate kinase [Methanomassiliicoccales archaeon]